MSKYFLPAPRVDNENRTKKGASSVSFTHCQDALIPGTRGIYSNKCAAKRRGINWLKVISVEGNKALIGWLKNSR